MKDYKFLITDLDGVIWRGEKPLLENIDIVKKLIEDGVEIVFLTNNSTRSRLEYVYRLHRYGIKTDVEHVINGAYLAAQYILEKGGEKIYVIGEAGLYHELSIAGLLPVTIGSDADYVVVGLDRFLTYDKVLYGVKLLLKGAGFIATNTDNVYPVEEGLAPGAGSIVEMMVNAAGREPEIVTGKPSKYVLDFIFRKYGIDKEKTLVIGDRIDIDIYMGSKYGLDTLFVLTGVGLLEDIDKYGIKPTYTVRNLREFYMKYK